METRQKTLRKACKCDIWVKCDNINQRFREEIKSRKHRVSLSDVRPDFASL